MVLLGWLGGMPAEEPFTGVSQAASILFFSYFFAALPFLSWLDRKRLELLSRKAN